MPKGHLIPDRSTKGQYRSGIAYRRYTLKFPPLPNEAGSAPRGFKGPLPTDLISIYIPYILRAISQKRAIRGVDFSSPPFPQ